MSVISSASKRTAKPAAANEASEYDGYWLNMGPTVAGAEGETGKFLRLPRGVAISDLKIRKVYENMDPEFAAEVNLINSVIKLLQSKCDGKTLAEGESMKVNLDVYLYRRQEEADVVEDKTVASSLEASLFG